MADIVLNDALGRIAEIVANGADLQIVPLSAVDDDGDLKDGYAGGSMLDDVLGDAANVEQTSGGWSRKVIANGTITLQVDDTADEVRVIIPDQSWTGPTEGNDTVALLVCEDNGGADSADQVLTKHDFVVNADGNDVTADFDGSAGFWSSS